MSQQINPRIVAPTQPINLDAYIYNLQLQLASLTWIEKIFGRAWKMYEQRDGMGNTMGMARGYAFPAVFAGATGTPSDYLNVLPNDNLRAMCFFAPRDPATTATAIPDSSESYEPNQYNEYTQPVSIIFWFNQDKLQPEVNYPITENLLAQVRALLRKVSYYKISNVYYDPESVFSGYSLDYVDEQYLMFPFGGFRIDGMLQFLETDEAGKCDPFIFPNP